MMLSAWTECCLYAASAVGLPRITSGIPQGRLGGAVRLLVVETVTVRDRLEGGF